MFFMSRKGSIVSKPVKEVVEKPRIPTPPPEEQDLSQFLFAKKSDKPVNEKWDKKIQKKEKGKKNFQKMVRRTMMIEKLKKGALIDKSASVSDTKSQSSGSSRRNSEFLGTTLTEDDWATMREQEKIRYLREKEEKRKLREEKWLESEENRIKEVEHINNTKNEIREKYLQEQCNQSFNGEKKKKKKKVIGWTEKNKKSHEQLITSSDSIFGESDLFFSQIFDKDSLFQAKDPNEVEKSLRKIVSAKTRSSLNTSSASMKEKLASLAENDDKPTIGKLGKITDMLDDLKQAKENEKKETYGLVNEFKSEEENQTPSTISVSAPELVSPTNLFAPSTILSKSDSSSPVRLRTPAQLEKNNSLDPNIMKSMIRPSDSRPARSPLPSPRPLRINKSPMPTSTVERKSRSPIPSPRNNSKPERSPRGSPNRSIQSDPGTRSHKSLLTPNDRARNASNRNISAPNLTLKPPTIEKSSPRPSPRRAFEKSPTRNGIGKPSPNPSPFKKLSITTSNKNKISPSPVPSPQVARRNSLRIEDLDDNKAMPSPRRSPRISSLNPAASLPPNSNDRKEKMKERREKFEAKKKEEEEERQKKLNPTRKPAPRIVGNRKNVQNQQKVGNLLGWANGGVESVDKAIRKDLVKGS